jgi:hypothetical protein
MSQQFWIILLIILLALSVLISIGIFFFHKIINKYKNGLVLRIHMSDSTVKHYRYDEVPVDNLATVTETNLKGEEKHFVYTIQEECIEKGNWGKYIDFDYHVTLPINPKGRNNTPLMVELKELFKHIGALLDTDLHVKLLRNSKFEDFVKMLLWILLIAMIINVSLSTVTMVKSLSAKTAKNACVLTLDNSTWKTIYVASHNPPPIQPISS